MEEFLNDHLSLANKNNILRITFGKSDSDEIFDANLNESDIKRIIKNAKSIKNKIKTFSYIETTYIKGNEEYCLRNNELTYLIKNYDDYRNIGNKLLTKESHLKDEYMIPCLSDYDSIIEEEVLEIMLVSCFTIKIRKNRNTKQTCIEVIISKPNSVDKILNMINSLN
tara:strand:+ start:1617 stop:2120 length:504 start_codon:yes stop_codon:yes gene_type:complete